MKSAHSMDKVPGVMKVTGPLLVFGGPYSNLEATKAVLGESRRRAIPPGNIVCTGDLAAYCADPQGVIDLLRNSGIRIVMGNCEESLAAQAAECGCGFAEESACAALSGQWYPYADRNVDAESRLWMGSLPRQLDFEINGRRLVVVHGGVTSINRFIFATSDEAIEEELAASGCDGVIAGHCGLPFTCERAGRLWHNAGVIGMPANDGTPRVWFSVLAPLDGGILVEHHALDYDHSSAAARMRQRGLPEGYAAALETGLWPSCDVLTPAELAIRGQRLEPGTVFWRAPGKSVGRAQKRWPAVPEVANRKTLIA
jgi:predicted phosphodiesterase